jgi:hypothetical protein
VKADAAAYLQAFPSGDEHREVRLITDYVATREKEFVMLTGQQTEPVIYTLRSADQVTRDDAAVAYLGHGIALVEVVSSPPPKPASP